MGKIAVVFARRWLPAFFVLALGSCGGGGDGGGSNPALAPTAVSFNSVGSLTPPPFVVNAPPALAIGLVGSPAPTNLLFPPGVRQTSLPAVCQSAKYTVNAAALPAQRATAVAFTPVNPCDFAVTIGAGAYPGDPSLGELAGIEESGGRVSIRFGTGTLAIDSSGPQPAAVLTLATSGAVSTAGFALPRSTALNPAGFTFQTFGRWTVQPGDGTLTDGFFSMGMPSASIAAAGSATYRGVGRGTFVSAANGDMFAVSTSVMAQVDFIARTIRFTTTSTITVPATAAAGTLPSSNPALNLSGTLGFPVATNTFFGPIAGVTGNVMGRFYGTPLSAATATKPAGAPPEIGGTFGVFFPGVGSLIGSFGAQ